MEPGAIFGDDGNNENSETSNGTSNETNATAATTNTSNTTNGTRVTTSEQANSSDNGGSMGQDLEPVKTDALVVSNTRFGTNKRGARLQGRITNTGNETITAVTVSVRFLENGEPVSEEPVYDGTRGLSPGATWKFDVSARGGEYASVTD